MLTTCSAFNGNKWFCAIKKYLYSVFHIAFVSAVTACANLFGWELPVWWIFALLVVLTVLFAEDALPLAPLMCCGYVTVSASNNPAAEVGTSLFYSKSALVQLFVIAAVIVAALVARVAFDLSKPRSVVRMRSTPKLGAGILLLGLAYLTAGLTAARYYAPQWKSSLFGLVQLACIAVPYFLFHYTVNWHNVPRLYLAKIFVGLGFAVTAEVVGMYVKAFAALPEGVPFNREMLLTGWGIYNNVGFMIAFCIPFAFNLALRCRHSYVYALIADIFEVALVLTQSRGSILCGTTIFVACVIYTSVKLKGKYRWTTLGAGAGFFAVLGVAAAVFHTEVAALFDSMKQAGFESSARWVTYREGLKQFAESAQSVFFGNGFYSCQGYRFGNLPADSFLPPRYHNTVVQLLASGGLMAMVCYLCHRYQTLRLCLVRPTPEKLFALAAILALTLTSMVDCHFFNMGPTLVYSVVLIFTEDASKFSVAAQPPKPEFA